MNGIALTLRALHQGERDLERDLLAAAERFEPGWRWTESVGPIAGTKSCQIHHNGFVVQGRMRLVMDDGGESEVGPGDVFVCPPGHDAWVVGDEQVVVYDFAGAMAQEYAKKPSDG